MKHLATLVGQEDGGTLLAILVASSSLDQYIIQHPEMESTPAGLINLIPILLSI